MPPEHQLNFAPLKVDEWLTAKQLADHFGRDQNSAYRWRQEGHIPDKFVRFAGFREMFFHPDVVRHLETLFMEAHD